MKKLILLFSVLVLLPINSVYANETDTNIDEYDAISSENVPLNIFSGDFPEDYNKWTDLVYLNKLIYSIEKYFDIVFTYEEFTIAEDGSTLALFPSELLNDGKGNVITISIHENLLNIIVFREWQNVEEKEKYAVGLIQMISEENSIEETKNKYNEFQSRLDSYLIDGFPKEIHENAEKLIDTQQIFESNNEIFYEIALNYNSDQIYNNNIVHISAKTNDQLNSYKENSSVFSMTNPRIGKAKFELIDPMIQNPKIANEVSSPSSNSFNPDNYNIYNYEEVIRDREGMAGNNWTFYAEVLQYFEHENDTATALVFKNGNRDEIIMLTFLTLPEKRIVEGDTLDIYGISLGLTNYTTTLGASKTVPEVLVTKVLIQGIDY